jgi:hypothetical protein
VGALANFLRATSRILAALALSPHPDTAHARAVAEMHRGLRFDDYRTGTATSWTPPRGAYFAAKSGRARWKKARRVRG